MIDTYLMPIYPQRLCFLQEVLFWVAFQRFPLPSLNGYDPHEDSDVVDRYEVDVIVTELDGNEAARAGLPPDPRVVYEESDKSTLPLEWFDLIVEQSGRPIQPEFEERRKEAAEFWIEFNTWHPLFEAAIEYPASRIFVALREGRLSAQGRLLPHRDLDRSIEILDAEGRGFDSLPVVSIPAGFWSLSGIRWLESAAFNQREHYCWITCLTEDLLSVFPGDDPSQVAGVRRVGDVYALSRDSAAASPARNTRGRPPYPWERFHLEVASLVQRDELPAKKEAAIQHFQDWFDRTLGKKPSRAAIGDKLKPYYDRFKGNSGRK